MNSLNKCTVTEIINAYVHLDKKSSPRDYIRESCGIVFRVSGRASYSSNGREIIADNNHAVLFPNNSKYTLNVLEPGRYYCVNFLCEDTFIDEITSIELKDPRPYYDYCKRMRTMFMQGGYRAKLLSILYGIIAKLVTEEQQGGIVQAAVTYMEANLSDLTLTNKTLAKKINISDSYFRELFKATYGTTPHKYLIKLRINQAKQALCGTDMTIAEIAESCGFSSTYYFSKAFKAEVGMSPTEFRHSIGYTD